ncbi:MAG: hypothetical protein UZ17_ACD001002321 [Acidobacteria bacterium OLB17]|nr:MAG: hypothetical protein UZ17_ACD001002321 [Acidobacteria bacterium OLB17]MCZ2389772.1 hypothetical protein [Acidobacteriota bacterium]
MRYLSILSVICALFFSPVVAQKQRNEVASTATPPAAASTLPIKRVVLYSNGIAYIERRGAVDGNADIDLVFRQSQVDDVLKSMVVIDRGQGKIGSISYGSSQPASARTAEIPFTVDAETEDSADSRGGLANILSQLQGDNVLITYARGTASGAIVTVDKKQVSVGAKDESKQMTEYSVVIGSQNGELTSIPLSEIRSVKLLDANTRRDLNEFADAVSSARRRDSKTITISARGTGPREISVSYTVAAPIWKTSYRVVLDEKGDPFFQGWAIVDNVGDEDWRNIELSMISGSPVSFIQNLQKPLYRYRPIIPIPEDLNLVPQIYDPEAGEGSGFSSGNGNGSGDGYGGGASAAAPLPAPKLRLFSSANGNYIVSSGFKGSGLSDELTGRNSGVSTAAIGESAGDLFEYKILEPVTVVRNHSALIPIIQTKMEGERVSIFRDVDVSTVTTEAEADPEDPETAAASSTPRARIGVRLKNTSDLTFEGGPLTVMDAGSYAGEALMQRLNPREERLISYGVDLGTLIRMKTAEDRQPAKLIKAVEGVFQIHYFKTLRKTYWLSNQTHLPRVLYIERPVRNGWELSADTQKPASVTARFYRFRVELKPFETREITIGENLGMMDKYELRTLSPKDLHALVVKKTIDEATRAKLAPLVDLRLKINDIDLKIERGEKEAAEIAADQSRLRENIEALTKTTGGKTLISRYISRADEQETRIEALAAERRQLLAEKDTLEKKLANMIIDLELN